MFAGSIITMNMIQHYFISDFNESEVSVQPPEVDTPLKSLPYLFSPMSRANLTFDHLVVGIFFTIIVFLLTDKKRQNMLQTGKIHIKNIFSCII